MTMANRTRLTVVVVAVFFFVTSITITQVRGCRRGGRSLLMQQRSAQEALVNLKNDFDMNLDFNLRKIGFVDEGEPSKLI